MSRHSLNVNEKPSPSPVLIAMRAARIRRGWTEEERDKRRVCAKPVPWAPPTTTIEELEHQWRSEHSP